MTRMHHHTGFLVQYKYIVILMHDIQSITPDVVALILEKYTAEGYTFVTVSELFGFGEMQNDEAYYQRYHAANRVVPMS